MERSLGVLPDSEHRGSNPMQVSRGDPFAGDEEIQDLPSAIVGLLPVGADPDLGMNRRFVLRLQAGDRGGRSLDASADGPGVGISPALISSIPRSTRYGYSNRPRSGGPDAREPSA